MDLKAGSPLPGPLSCPLADVASESLVNYESHASWVGHRELAFRPGVRCRTSLQDLVTHSLCRVDQSSVAARPYVVREKGRLVHQTPEFCNRADGLTFHLSPFNSGLCGNYCLMHLSLFSLLVEAPLF